MKKSNLIIAAAALVMASCAQNEVLFQDFQEAAIAFKSQGINKNTKAELDMTWFTTSGDAFGVYGFKGGTKIFGTDTDAEKVIYSNNDWTHSTIRFWDKSANNYKFYAYAPFEATQTFSDGKFTFTGLDVIKNITDANSDIVVADPLENISYYNCTQTSVAGHGEGHVEFIFNHILSKLSFMAKSSIANSSAITSIKIKEIMINFPTANSATWVQATGVTGAITYDSYASADAINASGNASMASSDARKYSVVVYNNASGEALSTTAIEPDGANTYIVAPVNLDVTAHEFALKVKYEIAYTDDIVIDDYAYGTLSYSPNQNDYYVITIDVNPAQIEFCVDKVNGWVIASGDATVN